MAEIFPFRGLRYNKEIVNNYSKVVTQPYDKISPANQERYYQKHDYNMVRIIKGKEKAGDDGENKYTRAASFFQDWQDKNVLIRDSEPAIYAYNQEYEVDGEVRTRKGFVGLVKLQAPGEGVKAHESTMKGPKADRLKLMRAAEANFGHIFMLYSDKKRKANKALHKYTADHSPDIQAADDFGNVHKVWTITDQDIIKIVKETVSEKSLYIADGHHRYETAVNFMNECKQKGWRPQGVESFTHRMMTLINMDEPGLTILPTHRLIHGLESFSKEQFLNGARKNFEIETHNDSQQMFERLDNDLEVKHTFGFYPQGSNLHYSLTLKNEDIMDGLIPGRWSKTWKRLDVSILHKAILETLLGIGEKELEEETNVEYMRSREEALRNVDNGDFQMAFIMNPTSVDEVRKVADQGEKMPQKSTDFYPKLLTGLIMTKMDIVKSG